MDKIYSFIPKKTFFLILLLLIAIIIFFMIASFNQSSKNIPSSEPVISQTPSAITPLQKSVPGKTTTQDIEQTNTILTKQTLPNGEIKYGIKSTLLGRQNEIIFQNNTTQFERTIIIGNTTESANLKISNQVLKYGPAEKTIEGSQFYGARLKTYIYASKGFVFIGNSNSDEIYELQTFIPTTIEGYLTKYGEDIKEYGEIKE